MGSLFFIAQALGSLPKQCQSYDLHQWMISIVPLPRIFGLVVVGRDEIINTLPAIYVYSVKNITLQGS